MDYRINRNKKKEIRAGLGKTVIKVRVRAKMPVSLKGNVLGL
jgi:hypothetical protein